MLPVRTLVASVLLAACTAAQTATVRQTYPGCSVLTGSLTVRGFPVLGTTVQFSTALPSLIGVQAVLCLGATDPAIALRGCGLHASPDIIVPLSTTSANPIPLPIPNDPSLVSRVAYVQAAMTAPAVSFATSNAFRLTVGTR